MNPPVPPPPAEPGAPPPASEALPRGATVGRYFILRKLGEGGMGVVYAAFDPELDRKLALKVLSPARRKARFALSQARLLREAQAMARISHPNVVAVHDVGAHGDEVFIAMELVEGGTLTEWVEAKPRKLDELLRAFAEAGQGLAAAHEAGLVHRDFKPENVLVGADGRVRVTDFGLARVDDELAAPAPKSRSAASPALTRDGAIVGTPLFMSPEQAQGRVSDARSDQYGFCASLHWAIYGQPPPSPFLYGDPDAVTAGATPPDRPREIASPPALALPREPRLPSRVRRALLRGLSWDPAGRFPSMQELLSELSPSRRQATQRRALLAAAAVGILGAAAASARLARRPVELCTGAERRVSSAWGDADRTAVERSFSAADPAGGGRAAQRTVAVLDRYARDWAAAYTDACAATRLRGEQAEAVLSRRMICLDRRLHQVAALTNLFRSADGALVRKAVDAAMGLPPLSGCDASALSPAAALPSDPGARAEIEAIDRQLDEARALSSAGRHQEALGLAEKAAGAAERLSYWPTRSESLLVLGTELYTTGEPKGAERALRQAVLAADLAGADLDKATALTKLIYVQGCQLGAFADGRFLAEVGRPLLANLRNDEAKLEYHLQTGTMLHCQGRAEAALEAYQRALELADRGQGVSLPMKGILLSNMADAYTSLGRSADALRMLRQALQILSDTKGPEHPELAYVHYNMSEALRRLGDNKGAYESIQEAIRIRSAALGPEHPLVADALDRLALSLLEDGLYAEALVECERSLAIREKALGPNHVDLSYSLENLGAALIGVRQPAKAIPHLERAIALRLEARADPGELAEPRFSLARALWDSGRERAPARALAATARDAYLQAGQREQAEKVSAWLAAH